MTISRTLKCLYLAPDKPQFGPIREAVNKTLESLDVDPIPTTDLAGSLDRIEDALYDSDFLIADLTGNDSIVMYGVGVARTLGKPMLMTVQPIEKTLPFSEYVYLVYEPADLDLLQKKIKDWVSRNRSEIERGHAVA